MIIQIFGYGSLISAIGINGRGLSRQYNESDLKVVKLNGYQREWNAVKDDERYLGLRESNESYVNGVTFMMDDIDISAFLISEYSYPQNNSALYDFVDVSDKIIPKQNSKVFTCTTNCPSFDGDVPKYYYEVIRDCLKIRGKEFKTEFLLTSEPFGMPFFSFKD